MWSLIGTAQNADRDLAAGDTVWTGTPDAANPRQCAVLVKLGDGVKDLDGTGGLFELTATIGGQTLQPAPEYINVGTQVRSALIKAELWVPAGDAVTIAITSPNGADTDVDVTAYLLAMSLKTGFSLAATGLDAIEATAPATVAATFPEMIVQLWRRFFRKTTLTATTLTTFANDGATPITSQAVSDSGGTQTQGAAT